METRREIIVQAAVLTDELGYEVFSVPEGWGRDSTLVLTEIALRTHQIHVVSGVLSVWGRTPASLAMTAATLHQLSRGRFRARIGPSTSALVEGFYDRPFTRRRISCETPPHAFERGWLENRPASKTCRQRGRSDSVSRRRIEGALIPASAIEAGVGNTARG
jgi:hypothetical protein